MKVLTLNAGSSSQKSCVYELTAPLPVQPPTPLWEAHVNWTHPSGAAELQVKTATGATLYEVLTTDRHLVLERMLATLWSGDMRAIESPAELTVVGHRIVHGGQDYRQSTWLTPEVKDELDRLSVFAPLHNPVNLEGVTAIEQILGPSMPQVAVFDTAFHTTLPEAAAVYPGPYKWIEQGIRRYGFHGISHQFCAERAAHILQRDLASLRLITCHLGNGCSLAAVRGGQSVDTTMGFTPLEGLMMGSRSGSIDPGILIHLLQHQGYTAEQLDQELNQASGLKGISGVSSDLRQVAAAIAAGNSRAQLAFDLYIHRLRSSIGSMLASLNGLDALVFTAGVGEHSPVVRAAACAGFEFLGLQLDPQKNAAEPQDEDIATEKSTVRILVISTQEEWAIAQDCWRLMQAKEAMPTKEGQS